MFGLQAFGRATARALDEKLQGPVAILQVFLYVLVKDGPVELVGAERATYEEGARMSDDVAEKREAEKVLAGCDSRKLNVLVEAND